VLALLIYSKVGVSGYACEVCIQFHGQSKCRSAKGASREEARRAAIDNACAFLASGVTDSIACANTVPSSERCR
jgi:hypothetical protein